MEDSANRLAELGAQVQQEDAALDAEAKRESAAVASLDKRVSALETSGGSSGELDKRVAALETANADNGPKAVAAAQTAQQAVQTGQQLTTQVKDLRADIDAARGEIPGLAARVAKLETEAPKANDADLSALAARLDKIEAALAAPKSESRVAPEKPAPADNASAIAIIAGEIEDKLAAGAPFGTEVAALQRLGVDPAQLASLQAVAEEPRPGARWPNPSMRLRRRCWPRRRQRKAAGSSIAFSPISTASSGCTFSANSARDDPEAIVSRIGAECRRGDIAGAVAAFDKLPAAARQAAGDWPVKARARQAADAALQSIREAAVGRLAGGARP